MDTSTLIWVVVAVVVIAALVAFVVTRSRGREEAQRRKAAEIREDAAEHDRRLREQEAEAARTRAEAQLAEADAQQRRLEAERLAAEADRRSEGIDDLRTARDQRLRLADEHDPDVTAARDDREGYDSEPAGRRDPLPPARSDRDA